MSEYINGSLVPETPVDRTMDILAGQQVTMMGGVGHSKNDTTKSDISRYLKSDDEEKLKTIKDKVDPDGKLDSQQIIDILDVLFQKAGLKWNEKRIDQALRIVVLLSLSHEVTNSLNDGKERKEG